jgi:prepilin-type N-terminal cleavage/methylation domain-containing protein
MVSRDRNRAPHDGGYSLIEMLIVTAIILILATMPVALLRRSREKTYEAEALRALRMMALAYENYYAQQGHMYPNYRTDGAITEDTRYKNAEAVWDDIVRLSLVPRQYSGYPHDRRDLLARGYRLSIFPADYGARTGGGARNTYALAMMPYQGSMAQRGIAVVQGPRFLSNYPTAIPRKMGRLGLFSLTVYTLGD